MNTGILAVLKRQSPNSRRWGSDERHEGGFLEGGTSTQPCPNGDEDKTIERAGMYARREQDGKSRANRRQSQVLRIDQRSGM